MSFKVLSSKSLKKHAQAAPLVLTPRQLKKPPKSALKVHLEREGELPDVLHGAGHPIVSEAARKALGKKAIFYEVEVRDTKKAKVGRKYYLVRAMVTINCLEWKQCGLTWSGRPYLSPMASFEKLVFVSGNVDKKTTLFSPECAPGVIVVRDELAKKLKGHSGIRFVSGAGSSFSVDPASPAEDEELAKLKAKAVGFGNRTARHADIEEGIDLREQADDWWYHDGAMGFEAEDIDIPDAWAAEVRKAYMDAFVAAVRSRSGR